MGKGPRLNAHWNLKGKMVHLLIGASNSRELFTTLLRLDVSFGMTPHIASRFCRNYNQVLRPKPENRPPMVLRPKPPNPLEKRIRYASYTISTCVTVVLDRPITSSLSPPLDLANHRLDLVNTTPPPHVPLLVVRKPTFQQVGHEKPSPSRVPWVKMWKLDGGLRLN